MAREIRKQETESKQSNWLTTYGDMVTLLMCFFVLLFAMSEIDSQKFDAVIESFQGSAGILSGGYTLSSSELIFTGMPEVSVANSVFQEKNGTEKKFKDLQDKINDYLEEHELQEGVIVNLEDRGLVIRFKDNVLFDSGLATIKNESHEVLNFLGDLLQTSDFQQEFVRVEGHADNIPSKTLLYPTNWELSVSRATNVVRYFIDYSGIEPSRLSASGYGEYHPIASNSTAEGRSQNRRVDVVILKETYQDLEPTDQNNGGRTIE